MKLFACEEYKALSDKNGPTGITRGLGNIIGIAELAGGLVRVHPARHTAVARRCAGSG